MIEPSWVSLAAPYVQTFGPAVSWIIVLIGWRYVSRDNDRRERRKEIRILVKDAMDFIYKIEDDAYECYRMDFKDGEKLVMNLRRDVQRLATMLAGLQHANKGLQVDAQMQEFRQRITGQDFESPSRSARESTDRIFLEITTAAMNLADALEKKFGDAYSPK